MNITLLSLIYFIAFSHAVMLAVALWRQTSRGQSGRILAVFIAVFAYKMFEAGVMFSDLYHFIPHLLDWLPGVVLIIGPIFYAYIRAVAGKRKFSNLQWLLHFTPAILLIAFNSPQLFVEASIKINNIARIRAYEGPIELPTQIVFLLLLLKLHLGIYLIKSWKILARFESKAYQLRADNSALILKRHKQLCIALFLLEATWVILFILQQTIGFFALEYVSTIWRLFMASIIMAMGYYGLEQPSIVFSDSEQALVANDSSIPLQGKPQNLESNVIKLNSAEKEKYQQSLLSDDAASDLAKQISQALSQKQLFLNDKLTLSILADELSIKPHLISQVISQSMKTNFYQLINEYRVNFAIHLLQNTDSNWSIERVAYESGFGNRVTFNNAFKSFKGCTPSAYRKKLKQTG